MCSRYYIDDDIINDISTLLPDIKCSEAMASTRDIHPGDKAPIVRGGKTGFSLVDMKWGYPQYSGGKGLLINARSETVLQKPTFSESVLYRRCVIPARRFYEWDDSRNKVSFSREGGTTLYMAGFFNLIQDELRFVILTTAANASVRPVHERMPLVLEKKKLRNGYTIQWKHRGS
ncbi:MAG: SOS response-associated peptidase [Clostridiales bacterium]|nr:SOS response-associated peptidase [Clostridiales bacterium]